VIRAKMRREKTLKLMTRKRVARAYSVEENAALLAEAKNLARQKLESIGTLAGGIAHDFNNLLGGILAEAELGEADLAAGWSPVKELHRIKDGAIRGAEIVRELMTSSGQDKAAHGLE